MGKAEYGRYPLGGIWEELEFDWENGEMVNLAEIRRK